MVDQKENDTTERAGEQPASGEGDLSGKAKKQYDKARKDFDKAFGSVRQQVRGFDTKETKSRVEAWVQKNPTLTIFLSVGAGILAGRLMKKAFTPSPPPPLSERARSQAGKLTADMQRYARDTRDEVSKRTAEAQKDLGRRAGEARKNLSRRSEEWSEATSRQAADLGNRASKQAAQFKKEASRQASEAGKRFSEQAGQAGKYARDSSDKASKTLKKKARHGSNIMEVLLLSLRSAAIAGVLGQVGRWMRKFK